MEKTESLTNYELSQIPSHLRDRVSKVFAAQGTSQRLLEHFQGNVVCTGLRPTPTGGVMKTCHHNDPKGVVRGWVEDWRAENKRVKELEMQLASAGWRPIAEAPQDTTPVDLWAPKYNQRLCNMRRVQLKKDNVFYEAIESGYMCVRDATHFIIVPQPPEMA
jgi:hypothetical protein